MRKLLVLGLLLVPTFGCRKLATIALDHETDGGFSQVTGGSGDGKKGGKACDLVTDAEIEAASGKKITKKEGSGDSCSWALQGAAGGPGNGMGSISLQIIGEAPLKIIPTFGQSYPVTGVGNSAEWYGGMAPNLRVHVKNGMVLNFLFVDPGAMMKAPGISEKKIDKNTSAVNMEYPELEKEAVAIGKAAASRY